MTLEIVNWIECCQFGPGWEDGFTEGVTSSIHLCLDVERLSLSYTVLAFTMKHSHMPAHDCDCRSHCCQVVLMNVVKENTFLVLCENPTDAS